MSFNINTTNRFSVFAAPVKQPAPKSQPPREKKSDPAPTPAVETPAPRETYSDNKRGNRGSENRNRGDNRRGDNRKGEYRGGENRGDNRRGDNYRKFDNREGGNENRRFDNREGGNENRRFDNREGGNEGRRYDNREGGNENRRGAPREFKEGRTPQRKYDRHSGTGRPPNEEKKGNSGARNWGTFKDDIVVSEEHVAVENTAPETDVLENKEEILSEPPITVEPEPEVPEKKIFL